MKYLFFPYGDSLKYDGSIGIDALRYCWFVTDGQYIVDVPSWSDDDNHPKGLTRYWDELRKGWHIVPTGTRFIYVLGLKSGERVHRIEDENRDNLVVSHFVCTRLNMDHDNVLIKEFSNQLVDDPSSWGVIDLWRSNMSNSNLVDTTICEKWILLQNWLESKRSQRSPVGHEWDVPRGHKLPKLCAIHFDGYRITIEECRAAWSRELKRKRLEMVEQERQRFPVQLDDICADDV